MKMITSSIEHIAHPLMVDIAKRPSSSAADALNTVNNENLEKVEKSIRRKMLNRRKKIDLSSADERVK